MSAVNGFDVLHQRGFVKQVTDEDVVRKAFASGTVTAYVGFDPTAPSLHIGHLLGLMALANLQRAGHRPIGIIGDGTAMIGDPSGKTEMRQMLSAEKIAENSEKIKAQIGRYFSIDGEAGLAVHNASWLMRLNYVDFLRDIGPHFSVNRMLSAEAYKIRLETGLTFLEFTYQILQAYDFLRLYEDYDCTLQLGGDDQWGNILAGVDLIRRKKGGEAEGLTWPLLTTASGQKMGKTAAGAVWLDADMVSPYEFYQYWINVDDRDVRRFLAYYTFLPIAEVEAMGHLRGADIREAKERLAFEATKITHGEDEARKARSSSRAAFGGSHVVDLDALPSSTIELERLRKGVVAVDLFADVGLVSSKSEGRRLIKQGGAYVNERRVDAIDALITDADRQEDVIILRAGRKRYHRLVTRG